MPYIGKPQSADPITVNSSNITDGTIVNADLSSSLTASISGAFTETSSSLALRLTDATGSINNISSSNSTRTTTLEAASSSLASDVVTLKGGGTLQSVATNASPTFVGATITGTLTAQEVHTEFESASIIFSSGSTIFGDTSDDTHRMTGSLNVSGAINLNDGDLIVTDNIGIGTDSPDGKVHIHTASAGSVSAHASADELVVEGSANSGINILSGNSNEGGIYFGDDGDNDIGRIRYDHSNNSLDFFANASERMMINSSGNVGIGTNNPSDELEVHGATAAIKIRSTGTSAGNNPSINFQSTEATGLAARAEISADDDGATTKGALIFKTRISDSVTEAMRIDGTGKVGINTDSPSYFLHVRAADGDSDNTAVARFENLEATAGRSKGVMITAGSSADDWPLHIESAGGSDLMRLTGAGRLGIGFSSPETTLQVSGSIGSKLGGGGFISIIRKDAAITDGDLLGAIRFGGEETDQQVSAIIQAKCDATWATNDLPTRLEFLTTPDGAGDQVLRMTIDKDGFLNVPGVYTGNTSSAANVHVTSGGFIYRSTSARKYKTNIQNYTVGLDKVNQMQPISYKSLTDTIVDSDNVDKTYAGLLADDIHDLGLSEFVEYAENGEVENLFYDRMVAVCINAIKELSTKNDALEKRIEELEK